MFGSVWLFFRPIHGGPLGKSQPLTLGRPVRSRAKCPIFTKRPVPARRNNVNRRLLEAKDEAILPCFLQQFIASGRASFWPERRVLPISRAS
jgi:hypothetical protein